MSNVTVTILQNGRCDDYGIPLVAGSSYSLDYDRAKALWQAGLASVTDPNVFEDDNTFSDGGIVRFFKFPGFRKCLLASLVANSTASRSNRLVTVAAPGHAITTGSTYQGYRFFYPGSASLAAGWYDSIVSIADANTLTFSAPGPDFASESVNGAAAYTSLTAICSAIIPAGTLKNNSTIGGVFFRSGDTTAVVKGVRGILNGQQFGYATVTANPVGINRVSAFVLPDPGTNQARVVGASVLDYGTTSSNFNNQAINLNVDQEYQLHGIVNTAPGFLAIISAHGEIT